MLRALKQAADILHSLGLTLCSNYGVKTVELAAPGYAIMSTILPGYNSFNFDCGLNKLYCYETGTSQAAPFVAGAGALAKAASGGRLTNVQVGWECVCWRRGWERL